MLLRVELLKNSYRSNRIHTILPVVEIKECDGLEVPFGPDIALGNVFDQSKFFDLQFTPFQIRSFLMYCTN